MSDVVVSYLRYTEIGEVHGELKGFCELYFVSGGIFNLFSNIYLALTINKHLLTSSDSKYINKVSCYRPLTLQRGVTGTARMLHALTHSSIISTS